MKKVSIIIPMYNEQEVAEKCYEKIIDTLKSIEDKYDYEIIFINDGSKDKTLEILRNIAQKNRKVKIISFSRNFGHQSAVTAGLKKVTGDAVVIIISVVISIIILVYAILSYVFNWNNLAAGWTSLMVTITFLCGMILISLWMIGEYIGRIYDETRGRPQYIIKETINFD